MTDKSERKMATRLIHAAASENGTTAVTPPIYQTSTYRMPTPEEGAVLSDAVAPAMFYGRYGSPNNKQVERMLADLEGAEAALAVGSGMAAITIAIVANVKAGDHVVAQNTHYTAALSLLTETLKKFDVGLTQVDQRDTAAFARAVQPNTRIVYSESPTNPTMDLTDLAATAEIAHSVGALAITDNTFGSPYNQRPLELGYDLVVHSATKYLNGHSDVVAGAIMGSEELIVAAWEYLRIFGPVLHPLDGWLLRRGLLTFPLRMERHNANGLAVARALEANPAVERVYYPGLESHPQHDLALKQMPGGFGGMLAFELKGGYDAAYRAIGRTEVCTLAVSLGGVETLITHPASMVYSHQTDEERARSGISPGLIRLSVGLEDPSDIIADLEQAIG